MDCSIICKHTVPLSAFLTSFFSIDHPKLKVMLRKKSLFLTGHSYRGDMLNYWQLEVRVNNYCIYADFKGLWNFHRTPKSSFSVGHQLKCGQGQEKNPKKTDGWFFFSHNAKAQNNETTFLPGTFWNLKQAQDCDHFDVWKCDELWVHTHWLRTCDLRLTVADTVHNLPFWNWNWLT